MSQGVNNIFTFSDRLQMESLNQRLQRNNVINSNIANAETPGFRAIGYDFEEQLQSLAGQNEPLGMRVSDARHKQHEFTSADGSILPDVFVRPTESVGHDGNTVDMDREMADLSHNQILFQTAIETITRKIGLLSYAIHGGRG